HADSEDDLAGDALQNAHVLTYQPFSVIWFALNPCYWGQDVDLLFLYLRAEKGLNLAHLIPHLTGSYRFKYNEKGYKEYLGIYLNTQMSGIVNHMEKIWAFFVLNFCIISLVCAFCDAV
ncbi:hypothetical protein ACJX0J_023316, partial [Zea mays]